MSYLFRTKDKKGNLHSRWRFQYTDWQGVRRTATGTTSKDETKKIAAQVQSEQDAIRRGWKPVPKEADKPHSLKDVVVEYMAWGKSQGGHGGRAWALGHARMRLSLLDYWQKRLHIESVQDISLSDVEAVLQELQKKGRSVEAGGNGRPLTGKSLGNYAEAIHALCLWAKSRHYLDSDPLEDLSRFDTTPKSVRRALTPEEIARLLEHSETDEERLFYEVALCTGFRLGELEALKVQNLDYVNCILSLEAEHTKNRKRVNQPIPSILAKELQRVSQGKSPDSPLLTIRNRPLPHFYETLKRAGISQTSPGGKVDLHALRTTYTTLAIEAGANVKEAQTLARHSTPNLTLNTYARTRFDRLSGLAESVGDVVFQPRKSITEAQRKAVGAENLCQHETCVVGEAGFEPARALPRGF